MIDQMDGQMSLFDLDIWCGKTYPEPLVQTGVKISERCLKKPQKSQTKMPLFLDLRGGGSRAGVSWEMGGLLLGEYTMRSFGEYPKEENVSLLSQILEDSPHPKYCLSEKAALGILNRAEKRGKKLPENLKKTLEKQAQSAFKNVLENPGGGKGILIQNEHTGALSTLNNQSVLSRGINGDIAGTLDANYYKGCGEREGTEREVVCCYSQDAYDKYSENSKAATIKQSGGIYGGGQRSACDTVGALCAADYKGVGNQYVGQGKLVVQYQG